jgi:uncharacterized protein YbbK (DUF523 family)
MRTTLDLPESLVEGARRLLGFKERSKHKHSYQVRTGARAPGLLRNRYTAPGSPEVEAGLGTPRESMRLVRAASDDRAGRGTIARHHRLFP